MGKPQRSQLKRRKQLRRQLKRRKQLRSQLKRRKKMITKRRKKRKRVMRRKRRRKRNKKSFKSPPHLQYQLKIATKHVNLRVSPTLITPKKSYRRYKTTIIRKKSRP